MHQPALQHLALGRIGVVRHHAEFGGAGKRGQRAGRARPCLRRGADAILVLGRRKAGRVVAEQVLDRVILEEAADRNRAGRCWCCRAWRAAVRTADKRRRAEITSRPDLRRPWSSAPTSRARCAPSRGRASRARGRTAQWRPARGSGLTATPVVRRAPRAIAVLHARRQLAATCCASRQQVLAPVEDQRQLAKVGCRGPSAQATALSPPAASPPT